jgi:hypothetical protein
MPSIAAIKERCEYLIQQGRGNESAHLVVWDEELKARKETKEKTRVQFETDSHDLYVAFNEEIHRVIKRAGVKAVGLQILLDWLCELKDPVIDRFMAAREKPNGA